VVFLFRKWPGIRGNRVPLLPSLSRNARSFVSPNSAPFEVSLTNSLAIEVPTAEGVPHCRLTSGNSTEITSWIKITVLPFYLSPADFFLREVRREKKLGIFLAAAIMVVGDLVLVAGYALCLGGK
jgi:hypothetical protein